MPSPIRRRLLFRFCLIAAVLMPVTYFATQFAAMPFFPGYSLALHPASLLGTSASLHPWIFNFGAILTGIFGIAGAFGLYQALRARTNFFMATFNGLSLAATGIMSVKAGLFPMPDPRHASWGFLTAFTIAAPLFLLIALWGRRAPLGLRFYLLACNCLVLFLLLVSARIVPVPLPGGIFQRLFALATFVPLGVVAFWLQREKESAAE